ncbi:hypothetical protein HKX48_003759, partial [Thoreauomyces humboldtii]
SVPPDSIVASYRSLVASLTAPSSPSSSSSSFSSRHVDPQPPRRPVLAVHCVSGIGRAAVLVAVGLIDGGMEAEAAVELIRSKRRGALNRNQLRWLLDKDGLRRLKKPKQGLLSRMFKK